MKTKKKLTKLDKTRQDISYIIQDLSEEIIDIRRQVISGQYYDYDNENYSDEDTVLELDETCKKVLFNKYEALLKIESRLYKCLYEDCRV